MAIAKEKYCEHCVDSEGNLQPFEVRFKEMVALISNREPSISPEEAEERVRKYMRKMPAWADRLELK